ncbi:MAG: hypothetical protein IT457_06150 [Planctomycetes bacterium]|nr:hypothetical protein [Planctomycetota bacterium]
MAYDSARDRVVLFGGSPDYSHTAWFRDTWEWDGVSWRELPEATVGVPEGGRYGHVMAFDSRRNRIVLFGGAWGTNNPYDSTWEFDGSTWIHRPVVGSRPLGGASCAMAYDSVRGVTVLLRDDTAWEWNGSVWAEPSQNPKPSPGRSVPAIAFDAGRARIVLFSGSPSLDDTWEWDGTTWTQRFPATRPPGRWGHAMTFDSQRGRVVMFGGSYGSNINENWGDTWEWDGTDWTRVMPGTSPSPRTSLAMVYQALRGRPLLFGGSTLGVSSHDDTWEYLQPFPATFTPFGAGCSGSAGTPSLAASSGSQPWIGSTFTARLDAIGTHPFFNIPFVLVGFSRTIWGTFSLPFDLTPYGMTGCSLLAEPAISFTLPNQGGFALWSVALPNDPRIAGSSLFVQGGTTSFGTNPLGIVLSNGCELAIGAR